MKKILLIFCCCLFFLYTHAQVSNDSCLSAIDLGTIDYPWNGGMNCYNFVPMDTVIFVPSTIGAQPNFPYPFNPFACSGYTSNLIIPANDVWYKLSNVTGCEFDVAFNAIDTLQVSLWAGDTCAYLVPFACFTIPGGTTTYETISWGLSTSVYLQISGNGLGKFVGFSMCLRASPIQCSIAAGNFTPTPVKCFYYETIKTNTTNGTSMDGSAYINMIYGSPPYSILWNDGNTNWTRTNLNAGTYFFTVQDGNGCEELDSLVIESTTSIIDHDRNLTLHISPNPSSEEVVVKINSEDVLFDKENFLLRIYDLRGKEILAKSMKAKNELVIVKGELLQGFYSCELTINERIVRTAKMVIL